MTNYRIRLLMLSRPAGRARCMAYEGVAQRYRFYICGCDAIVVDSETGCARLLVDQRGREERNHDLVVPHE